MQGVVAGAAAGCARVGRDRPARGPAGRSGATSRVARPGAGPEAPACTGPARRPKTPRLEPATGPEAPACTGPARRPDRHARGPGAMQIGSAPPSLPPSLPCRVRWRAADPCRRGEGCGSSRVRRALRPGRGARAGRREAAPAGMRTAAPIGRREREHLGAAGTEDGAHDRRGRPRGGTGQGGRRSASQGEAEARVNRTESRAPPLQTFPASRQTGYGPIPPCGRTGIPVWPRRTWRRCLWE